MPKKKTKKRRRATEGCFITKRKSSTVCGCYNAKGQFRFRKSSYCKGRAKRR